MRYYVDEDRITGKEFWLACIANELAEANRLKRLDMKYNGKYQFPDEELNEQ